MRMVNQANQIENNEMRLHMELESVNVYLVIQPEWISSLNVRVQMDHFEWIILHINFHISQTNE